MSCSNDFDPLTTSFCLFYLIQSFSPITLKCAKIPNEMAYHIVKANNMILISSKRDYEDLLEFQVFKRGIRDRKTGQTVSVLPFLQSIRLKRGE